MRRPSGEYAADQTPSPWPESTASCLAVAGVPDTRGPVSRRP